MHICFAWLPAGLSHSTPPAVSHRGRDFELTVFRRNSSGPVYPHIALDSSPERLRFFAGRLAGGLSSDGVFPSPLETWPAKDEPGGSWLALTVDLESDVLEAAADSFLLSRWYYTERRGGIYLSNSLLYLKELLGSELDLNEAAIPYLLRWGYLPYAHTPLNGVFSLRSRELLTFRKSELEITRRRTADYHVAESSDPTAAERILPALQEAVAAELAGLDSVCIPLSGGMDSRVLLAMALESLDASRIQTITFGAINSLDYRIGHALASKLGVQNSRLEFDTRPIGELLRESFPVAEGIYNAVPNHPVAAMRSAASDYPHMLLGYVGDVVFGSYDPSDKIAHQIDNDPRALLRKALHTADQNLAEVYRPLLRLPTIDPLQFENTLLHTTGLARHRHADWVWENHQFNRTNFAILLYRDRTFYLTPFVHPAVMREAYALPIDDRLHERAFFREIRKTYPRLYSFPAKSNHGFPLGKTGFIVNSTRAWRKAWSEVDRIFGSATGTILYAHPRNNYAHPRELLRSRHRNDVLAALDRLADQGVFESDKLRAFRSSYRSRRLPSPSLLQSLLTVDQWYLHYT